MNFNRFFRNMQKPICSKEQYPSETSLEEACGSLSENIIIPTRGLIVAARIVEPKGCFTGYDCISAGQIKLPHAPLIIMCAMKTLVAVGACYIDLILR